MTWWMKWWLPRPWANYLLKAHIIVIYQFTFSARTLLPKERKPETLAWILPTCVSFTHLGTPNRSCVYRMYIKDCNAKFHHQEAACQYIKDTICIFHLYNNKIHFINISLCIKGDLRRKKYEREIKNKYILDKNVFPKEGANHPSLTHKANVLLLHHFGQPW